jgi:hypothetical protein
LKAAQKVGFHFVKALLRDVTRLQRLPPVFHETRPSNGAVQASKGYGASSVMDIALSRSLHCLHRSEGRQVLIAAHSGHSGEEARAAPLLPPRLVHCPRQRG